MKRKILVVDDEKEVRDTIRIQLAGSGFDVVEAEDGEKGIEKINAGDSPITVDCIICDVRMPKINGVEAVAYFRKQYPSTPVIVLTGYPDTKLAVDFMKQGVVEYLVKPVEKEKLLEAVKNAVSKHKFFSDTADVM